VTRPSADVLADLAALAARQAELTAELAQALRVASVPAPACPANDVPEYLTTAEAAAVIGVSERHLKALRAEGRGPAFLRVGRSVRYPRSGLCR
jgi:excisionase family DNA binding protein